MKLVRTKSCANGIFGELQDDSGNRLFYTLEHAYLQPDRSWVPKLASGTYTCVRGEHQLEHMPAPFEAFEVTGVPPFQGKPVTGILFHVGNYNKDSIGCILLGKDYDFPMITQSRAAFEAFMASLAGQDQFTLTVL